ncbi:glycosyltransferase family protein [Brevibacillus sp. H7]|uniref:glycosyltransferase family protein n=1 Tax=Brevibacillus sp. H7 TaxID=3349138 RepID=UPI003814117D
MEKLKILLITGDIKDFICAHVCDLMTELAKMTELTLWTQPGNIHDIIKKISKKPDFIFINEFGETKTPPITGLSTLSIPFGVYMYDLHYRIKDRKKALRSNKVNYIFSVYRDPFYQWYPEFKDKMRWLPLHVNSEVYRDYGLEKEIDWLLMGAVDNVYPLRYRILQEMSNQTNFVYHKHPGYRNYKPHERQKYFIGEKYAREINRAKMFFTCDSVYNYPVAKYYEVPACKSLLLAPSVNELLDLGFVPGQHFVAINDHDFREKAEYFLKNEWERNKITEQGYRLVHENHTSVIRARQLLEMIKEILENHKTTVVHSPKLIQKRKASMKRARLTRNLKLSKYKKPKKR